MKLLVTVEVEITQRGNRTQTKVIVDKPVRCGKLKELQTLHAAKDAINRVILLGDKA